jgi:uncharacterized protein (DUF2267 family)
MESKERLWQTEEQDRTPDNPPAPEAIRPPKAGAWKAGEYPLENLPVINKSVEAFSEWIRLVATELNTQDMKLAYHALRGVLFTLRDRLTPEEVFDLSAQLPLLVRGLLFEGYRPMGKPERIHAEAFRKRVQKEMPQRDDIPLDVVIRAVIRVMSQQITAGEFEDIQHQMPKDLKPLLFGLKVD